jgi:hypothetical protein
MMSAIKVNQTGFRPVSDDLLFRKYSLDRHRSTQSPNPFFKETLRDEDDDRITDQVADNRHKTTQKVTQ